VTGFEGPRTAPCARPATTPEGGHRGLDRPGYHRACRRSHATVRVAGGDGSISGHSAATGWPWHSANPHDRQSDHRGAWVNRITRLEGS
jgi:hypothetical protein